MTGKNNSIEIAGREVQVCLADYFKKQGSLHPTEEALQVIESSNVTLHIVESGISTCVVWNSCYHYTFQTNETPQWCIINIKQI